MSVGPSETETPLELAPTLGRAGILVVDDDPAFQLGLKTFLREYAGFENVFTARSGYEALTLIDSEPSIEVITLDNVMPGMSGMDMLAKLADSGRATAECGDDYRSIDQGVGRKLPQIQGTQSVDQSLFVEARPIRGVGAGDFEVLRGIGFHSANGRNSECHQWWWR